MNLVSRSLAALGAATVLVGGANAATTTSSFQFGYAADGVTYAPVQTEIGDTFSLAGFDTSLGTLTSVILNYGYRIVSTGTVLLNGTGSSATSGRVTAGNTSDAFVTFENSAYSSADLTATADQTINPANVGTTYSINTTSALVAETQDITNAYLSGIAGAAVKGTFSSETGSDLRIVPNGGNADAHTSTTASGYVNVIYTYTVAVVSPVPEPTSWAMMVGGFGLLGGALRRSRAKTTTAFS